MSTKQQSIIFPIRKRNTKSKNGKSLEQTKRGNTRKNLDDFSDSDDEIQVIGTFSPKTTDSPALRSPRKTQRPRGSARVQSPFIQSPRRSSRRTANPRSYRELSVSPCKAKTATNRVVRTPKKLTYENESPVDPVSDHDSPSVTPRKNTNTPKSVRLSSRKRDTSVNYVEVNASPRRATLRRGTGTQDEKFDTPKKALFGREPSSELLSPTRLNSRSSSGLVTPSKGSRNENTTQTFLSPTKRRIFSSEVEECLSPSKRMVVLVQRFPKEPESLPVSSSPSSKCQEICGSPKSSSIKQNTPLSQLPVPSPDKSPDTQRTITTTPLKTRQANILSSPLKATLPQTPERATDRLTLECRSSPRSVVKRLNMTSPVKSPLKPMLLASPRRSPRKHINNENVPSPRSLRKEAQSPLRFNSPSSLVSRLSLDSPSNCKKNLAVGLFRPDVSVYRALRQSLNTGTPSVLVCREKQTNEIKEFLSHHLTKHRPGSIYISGAPGTGKTASLNHNLETLNMKQVKKVFLNCMTLKTTAAIYKTILSELGRSVFSSEKENRHTIEKVITTSKHPILLMLDEVDQLDSKNQEVLYTIFEWPALPNSSLVLVGIANSLDLTDRILPRLQALPNFRPKLLHFPPYSKKEIVQIITHRIKEANLGDVQVIRPAAIQLLAGKVAAVAGDIRKALDVCRRAVELCEGQARRQTVLKPANASPQKSQSPRKSASKNSLENTVLRKVEIPQILSIFNEVYGSRVVSAVTNAPESFPLQQKILICCLLLILKYGRSKDVTLGKFHEVYTRVCKKKQVAGMDQTEFLSMCTLLESRGMLQVKRNKEIRNSKVLLLLNAKEAEDVLGDRNLLATILEDKESLGKLCSKLNKT